MTISTPAAIHKTMVVGSKRLRFCASSAAALI
jgi:hypothetical protein